ncbi:MAG: FAD-dependent oxidoreductase, partial [Actinomycetota bacterium]|nr:FAD-dependent oxidoreductase [Actinomycetota bacterium]
MRVAVVGAGVSGLVVSHLLHQAHQVTVFEANSYAGGHTHTVRVDTPNETHQVDTGFIVFNDRNYPNFERLLERLGVRSQRSTMSFSVSDGAGDFEYSSASANGLFAKRAHALSPWFARMIADLARFNRVGRELLTRHGDDVSLGDWLEDHRFSRAFIERLIVPQASAVWSADPREMWSFPARFLVEFFDNHGMLGFRDRPRWRTIRGGSACYVDALTASWRDRLRLRTPVRAIERSADHVLVEAQGCEAERFDQVVLATHSDQALELLADPNLAEEEILGAIPYKRNEAVLHTDVRMLPRRRRAWASWNYHLLDRPAGATT